MELDELRLEIDRVDDELLALFLRRMELAADIAGLKRGKGLPVLDSAREKEVLSRAQAAAGGEMAPYAREFFEGLMALSRERQRSLLEGGKGGAGSSAPAQSW